jgi:signal transduction histidine kinase
VGEIILYYGVPTALLLLGGGWVLLRKSLAPVTALTRAAERIHLDNLRERLPSTGSGDELDRLTEVFNAMTARLDESFARVRDFTLHASHELKTPLALMRTQLEMAFREQQLTPAQRELFASQLDEIQRLARIVDVLTLLAKVDAGHVRLNCEAVRLDDLVKDSVTDAQMLARSQKISVNLGACDEITVRGDRHRLRQLLLNLTDNAIKYNQPQGNVTIALNRNNGVAQLRIANTGAGILPENLPRVFDRFFRCDPAHSSDVEGCGLGLSIAQWIVKAHAGTIQLRSEPGKLTTVTVTLPVDSRALPV